MMAIVKKRIENKMVIIGKEEVPGVDPAGEYQRQVGPFNKGAWV